VSQSAIGSRRGTAAFVVVVAHVTAFWLMRHALLGRPSPVETIEFVSLSIPTESARDAHATRITEETTRASRFPRSASEPRRPSENRRSKMRSSVEHSLRIEPQPAPRRPIHGAPAIDWLGEAESTAQREIASEADRKRGEEWLARGTDPQTHPLMQALRPMYGKTPAFGWSHARTHRIEPVKGGPLLVWINDRCFVAIAALFIMPACALGHIEPNGALFEHMHDADVPVGVNVVP